MIKDACIDVNTNAWERLGGLVQNQSKWMASVPSGA